MINVLKKTFVNKMSNRHVLQQRDKNYKNRF